MRAAIVVSGLSALASTGCERIRDRVVDGTGFNGDLCAGWSLQGPPEACCTARNRAGGYVRWDRAAGVCASLPIPGPFVPPALDA